MVKRKYKAIGFISMFSLVLLSFSFWFFDNYVYAAESEGTMLNFYADFKPTQVEYGKAPFDDTDGNGFDSNSKNQLVRTFDSATYTLNITANPTVEGSVNDVVVRVWGELDGAISEDGRVNAVYSERASGEVFTVLNPEDSKEYDKPVSGVDFTYKLDRVGEAVSLPIDISVQGAYDNVEITPQIQIQVIEVDGKDVSNENIYVDMRNKLPGFKVTGRVSFDARVRRVIGGPLDLTTAKGALDDPTDMGWYSPIGSDFVLKNLPERTNGDLRGSTFPSGKIHFEYEMYSLVDWWDDPDSDKLTNREAMVYSKEGDRTEIAYHDDIDGSSVRKKVEKGSKGAKGLRWENESFNVINFANYGTGRSRMSDFKQDTIEKRYTYSVWDSGKWNIKPAKIVEIDSKDLSWDYGSVNGKTEILVHEATIQDYKIGYTFPTRRADGSWILAANERTVYDGLNMDVRSDGGQSGGMGVPVFASQTHIVYMPNSYRHGTKNNPDDRNNEEIHRFAIKVTGYENEDGELISVDTPTWKDAYNYTSITLDNRGAGSVSINQQFRGSKMKADNSGNITDEISNYPIANENYGYSMVATGDAQLIQGNNAYLMGDLRIGRASRGGVDHIQRWNVDTFSMTAKLAEKMAAMDLSRGYESIDGFNVIREEAKPFLTTLWGVQKFDDNSFASFMSKGIDDYDWFEDYLEAEKKGSVGAHMIRVTDGVSSGTTTRSAGISLFVHDQTLGSVNKKGTPHIAMSQGYVYFNGRDKAPSKSNYDYWDYTNNSRTFTTYTDDYVIDRIQSPNGSNTPIATLGIVPGSATGTLRSERSSIYSNQKSKWIGSTTLALPEQYQNDTEAAFDPYMTVEHTLPEGLRYVSGSGLSNKNEITPVVEIKDNGTQKLTWKLRLDQQRSASIEFETSVNPFGLSGSSSSEKLTIQQDVKHSLDKDMYQRRADNRRSKADINILRIGLVGIHGELNPTSGSVNEAYTYTLRPYTTMQDEHGVRGVWTVPHNGDELGSKFNGSLSINDITVLGRDDVTVWVHSDYKKIDRPDQVNTDEGWSKWNGQKTVGTIYFEAEDYLSAKDRLEILIEMQPNGNKIGDKYVHQSNINSNQGYKVSPVTERESFSVTPDAEIGLERIRIDTKKASEGLVADIQFSTIVYRDRVKEDEFGIELYEIDADNKNEKRIASWNTTFGKLESSLDSIELTIPSEQLTVSSSKSYEARINLYGKERIKVTDGNGRIDTLGYTATEEDIIYDIREDNSDNSLSYKGVVRTERYIGQDIQKYYEEWTVIPSVIKDMKSGYGLEFKQRLSYQNELGIDLEEVDTFLQVEEQAVDGSYESTEIVDLDSKHASVYKIIPLQQSENPEQWLEGEGAQVGYTQEFVLPEIFISKGDGEVFTENDRQNLSDSVQAKTLVEGGRFMYVPIWIPELGNFNVVWETEPNIGVNSVSFQTWDSMDVVAYMYATIGSKTIQDDELLIQPIYPDSTKPENWSKEELEWLIK